MALLIWSEIMGSVDLDLVLSGIELVGQAIPFVVKLLRAVLL